MDKWGDNMDAYIDHFSLAVDLRFSRNPVALHGLIQNAHTQNLQKSLCRQESRNDGCSIIANALGCLSSHFSLQNGK